MMRRLILAAAAVAVAAVIAVPALADHAPTVVTVTFTGRVTPGEVLTLTCPEGYQVRAEGGATVASATFYRDPNLRSVVATDVPPDPIYQQFSVSWTVPRGVRSATATLECLLIVQHPTTTSTPPSTTATTTVPTTSTTTPLLWLSDAPTLTLAAGESATLWCPEGTFIDTTTVQAGPFTVTGYDGAPSSVTVQNQTGAEATGQVTGTCRSFQ